MGKRTGRKIFGVGNSAGGGKGFFGRRSQARHHLLEDESSVYSNGMSFQKAWKEEMTTPTTEQPSRSAADDKENKVSTSGTSQVTNLNKPAVIKKNGSKTFTRRKGSSDAAAETDEETLSRSQSSSDSPSEKPSNPMLNETSASKHGLHIAMFPATQSVNPAQGTALQVPVKTNSYDEVELMFTISDDEEDDCDEDDQQGPAQPNATPAKAMTETELFLESPKGVSEFDNFADNDVNDAKPPAKAKNAQNKQMSRDEQRRRSSSQKRSSKSEKGAEDNAVLKPELPPRSISATSSNNEKENQGSQLSRGSGLVDSKQQRHEEALRNGVINDIGRVFLECSPMAGEGQRKSFSLSCARPTDVAHEGYFSGNNVEADEETKLFGASITTSVASMIQQLSQTLNCGTTMAQGEAGEAAILLEPEITKDTNLAAAVPLGPPQEIIAQHPDDDESLGDITDYTAEASFAMKALRGKGGADFMAKFAKEANAGANLATLTNPYSGKVCGDDEREHQYFTDYEDLGQESLQRGYARI